jgi:hypothetical protein
LKDIGVKTKEDREKLKKKIKELKSHNEKEKKDSVVGSNGSFGGVGVKKENKLLKKAGIVVAKMK